MKNDRMAILHVYHAKSLSKVEWNDIARWLRRQARWLQRQTIQPVNDTWTATYYKDDK